jgi:hypothetical protein
MYSVKTMSSAFFGDLSFFSLYAAESVTEEAMATSNFLRLNLACFSAFSHSLSTTRYELTMSLLQTL